jgi:hypothetical protein
VFTKTWQTKKNKRMVMANAAVSVPLDAFGNLTRKNKSRPKSTTSTTPNHGSEGELIRLNVGRMHVKKS